MDELNETYETLKSLVSQRWDFNSSAGGNFPNIIIIMSTSRLRHVEGLRNLLSEQEAWMDQ